MTDRVLVVVPTYDEAENIERVLARLHAAVPTAHALVVDDGSPDGTGELADELAVADARVHVLRRTAKTGLGPAYVAGFRWAREHGFDVVVEMDADGSHAPEQLPQLLAALESADLVLGSRYVPGGAVTDWPVHRLLLSRLGNRYTQLGAAAAARGRDRRLPRRPRRAHRLAAPRRRRQRGLLLPGRLGLAGGSRGRPRAGGADHFHRTCVRQEQDERLDRWRSIGAGHRLGTAGPAGRLAAGPGPPPRAGT